MRRSKLALDPRKYVATANQTAAFCRHSIPVIIIILALSEIVIKLYSVTRTNDACII